MVRRRNISGKTFWYPSLPFSLLPSLPPSHLSSLLSSFSLSVRASRMTWWHHDMMTWRHDDMMTWWHDDMMTWWHDDMMTWWHVKFLYPCKPTFPLWNLSFSVASPPSLLARNMMTWWHDVSPLPSASAEHIRFSEIFQRFRKLSLQQILLLQGRYKGLQGADIKSLEGRHWERCDKCSFYFTKSDQWSILVKENKHTRRYNPFYFTKSDEKCVLVK